MSETAKTAATNSSPLTQLRQLLKNHFSLEELETLAFDLGIDFEEFDGKGKSAKAREFVAYVGRQDRIEELLEKVAIARPSVPWPTVTSSDILWDDYISPELDDDSEEESLQKEADKEKAIAKILAVFTVVAIIVTIAMFGLATFGIAPFEPSWQFMNGPSGGNPWQLLSIPTKGYIYVSNAEEGVFKSEDGGLSWKSVSIGIADKRISKLVDDPEVEGTIYAVAREDGVYRTSDWGENWEAINEGLPQSVLVTDLAIYTGSPKQLILSTWGSGLWAANVESKINWEQRTELGLVDPNIHILELSSSATGILYASSSEQGLFQSLDLGLTWERIGFANEDIILVETVPWDSKLVFVNTAANETYSSTDGGTTWMSITHQFDGPPRSRFVIALSNNKNTAYLGTRSGSVYKLVEGNETWEKVWSNLPVAFIRDIEFEPFTDSILLATSSGVYVSLNEGDSWQQTGPKTLDVKKLAAISVGKDTSSIFAFTTDGVYQDTTNHHIWETVNGGLRELNIIDLTVPHNSLEQLAYAISDSGNLYQFFPTESRWQLIEPPDNERVAFIDSTFGEQETLYSVTRSGHIYRIFDKKNDAWEFLGDIPATPSFIAVDPTLNGDVYIGTEDAGMFKSTDMGISWFPINNGITNPHINDLAFAQSDDNSIYIATNNGVFITRDRGKTWTHSTDGLSSRQVNALTTHPSHEGVLYAGSLGGVFASFDFGKSWQAFRKGLAISDINAVYSDQENVYVGTNFGVYFMTHPMSLRSVWSQ